MIRFATENDIDKIMEFINLYWKEGHILATNKEFFKYEHLLEEGVSYVVSEADGGEINAILGYIPYGKSNRDIMTVMWKANHTAEPSLGMELFDYLKDNADVRLMASPGSNRKLMGLYKYLGYQFGKMVQWYRLNSQFTSYNIAIVENADVPQIAGNADYVEFGTWCELEKAFDWDYYKALNPKPYKEKWYVKKRYFDHPIYKYKVYGVKDENQKTVLLLIFRKVEVNGSSVLRLLDCIGNMTYMSGISAMLDELMTQEKAEYVDCYEVGISDEVMEAAGFLKVAKSGNIIPNYFSPFVQENIDIYYFSSDPEMILFKGDGDQDRPN